MVVPGRGEIDFPAFVRTLRTAGYTRPMMIELCQAEPGAESEARFLADTRVSHEFMQRVLARVADAEGP